MKILKKILPILSVSGLTLTPMLTATSCSCFAELNLTEQQQYIYDRTFSIMSKLNSKCYFGTGWIISDATKSNPNDYTYWMATNWHVQHVFTSFTIPTFYYADASLTSSADFVNYTNYKKFSAFNFEDTNKFTYSNTQQTFWTPSIDLSVIKVNFGSPTGEILTKLNKINDFQKQNGFINKFAKHSDEIAKKNKIIGGYPKKSNSTEFGGKWEAHSFESKFLDYKPKYTKYDGINSGHAIGDPIYNQDSSSRKGTESNFDYWDVSPQYKFNDYVNKSFMDGGASGSMMITQDYEVCGIYWGGWGVNDKYYPSFSLFNTDEKNFLEEYINN